MEISGFRVLGFAAVKEESWKFQGLGFRVCSSQGKLEISGTRVQGLQQRRKIREFSRLQLQSTGITGLQGTAIIASAY